MSFNSVKEMISEAENENRTLPETVLLHDLKDSAITREQSVRKMKYLWEVMQATSAGYCADDRSNSGLTGGNAAKIGRAASAGKLIGDPFMFEVIEESLKTAECNACMKRIVAAPTAGSCGILPGVLIPLSRRHSADPGFDDKIIESLYVAAGFGQVTAARASVSGAEGGCQAEIGTAAAMAAAALTWIGGGTASQCSDAFAIALTNMLGLVCDPVAGLVEIPCINRNAAGAMTAVSSADMALAGISSDIPADEVIDCMKEVGDVMVAELRETGKGGLAGTPTGRDIAARVLQKNSFAEK
ncbi:MAG: L-serine ammonia-lyase, iron-sulfur-dependent, subunit alpha [Eubacteriales bacterium]|nr:L-serine ammonia-lyase, iron-sulfur-dependent, subunit alpha [Eubacteriales bacterium]